MTSFLVPMWECPTFCVGMTEKERHAFSRSKNS
jgi:hypothetical protein